MYFPFSFPSCPVMIRPILNELSTALILMVWVTNHTTAYNINKRVLTPFTASSPLLLVKLVRGTGRAPSRYNEIKTKR